ncbi:DEAD/DEAH box helicase [Siminovitchia sp. FSL H7-0308]|uniref:Superfamily II DNA/RNA helicase n=1 Tax=Siminovitchia thermophila TaxID=1245522 RepID=A0ABS2R0X6_9BACI|nr:DEAD/DEAH box helicase [Siminovitchia thermophila]MBM7713060.1 superfamily II DNA/RNA helicase [Siminovitchia thermophila]ONK24700.1 RNA helicase [Bacillus sp. VT-16-64]
MNFLHSLKPALQENWKKSFTEPTPVQQRAIPSILEGKDVVAQSPTGTGKTVAYLLPILNRVDEEKEATQAVILAPSRELVMQIFEEIKAWSIGTGLTSVSLVGGANIKRQMEKLKKRPQLIVGTPGRIWELIQMKKLKMHEVKTIVLDEGDELLGKEHLDDVRRVVKSALNDRQLLLFSATALQDPDQVTAMLGREPERIVVEGELAVPSEIEHIYLLCEPREKINLLGKIAKMDGMKGLAFIRSIGNLHVIADKLSYEGVDLEILHSDMRKDERKKALQRLDSGDVSILLATDIAARGLDIKGISHVIHFDLAKDVEQYIHRSGRTGRMGKFGTVVSLVSPRDERELQKYGKLLGIPLSKKRLYKGGFHPAKNYQRRGK